MINSIYKSAFTLAIILVTILSCNQDSGVVTKYQGNQGQGTDDDSTKPDKAKGSNLVVDELHTVVVDEVLPATKYVYVHVSEGANQFWVATALKDVHVGETYFYKGGLLKTNFESKEYNRTFERIYLVSQFVPAKHDGSNSHVHDEETLTSTPVRRQAPRLLARCTGRSDGWPASVARGCGATCRRGHDQSAAQRVRARGVGVHGGRTRVDAAHGGEKHRALGRTQGSDDSERH